MYIKNLEIEFIAVKKPKEKQLGLGHPIIQIIVSRGIEQNGFGLFQTITVRDS